MALPQPHRLRDRRAFDRLQRQGKRSRSQTLTLWILPRPSESPSPAVIDHSRRGSSGSGVASAQASLASQFGVAVSKKVSKRAVVRNRLRRRIHAALICLLPHLRPGLWVLIAVRPQPESAVCQYAEILQELEQLLAHAGAIARPPEHLKPKRREPTQPRDSPIPSAKTP